ncbi:hypothetical protein [Mesomycoplasma lagogenitalium]|uniref:Uncharacterized protein n=1 Tax=Mesomycoplasma lagogenitalium TaxID=171286 RepID=A0ABY8LW24_9BACT|nr:hypothetical protein [Mesomycoplasma lagogenitalium]WGI36483.1 hypothetical protein QEG99_03395 [Mesomycoplasma lagogenitalium]
MTKENKIALNIYQYLKNKIKLLPHFWFQVVEDNGNYNDAMLFILEPAKSFDLYLDDNFKRVQFSTHLISNKNNHGLQLEMFKKIIKEVQKISELDDWWIRLKSINGVICEKGRDYSDRIQAESPSFNLDSQTYNFKIELLLEGKELNV